MIIFLTLILVFMIPLIAWGMEYGIQDSVSDYFRVFLKEHGSGSLKPYKFWLWLGCVGALFMLYFQNGYAFGTFAGLMFVGAAAQYWRNKNIEIPHIVGALGGILFAHGTVLNHAYEENLPIAGYISLSIGVVTALLFEKVIRINKRTYWIEVVQFIVVIVTITYLDFIR